MQACREAKGKAAADATYLRPFMLAWYREVINNQFLRATAGAGELSNQLVAAYPGDTEGGGRSEGRNSNLFDANGNAAFGQQYFTLHRLNFETRR